MDCKTFSKLFFKPYIHKQRDSTYFLDKNEFLVTLPARKQKGNAQLLLCASLHCYLKNFLRSLYSIVRHSETKVNVRTVVGTLTAIVTIVTIIVVVICLRSVLSWVLSWNASAHLSMDIPFLKIIVSNTKQKNKFYLYVTAPSGHFSTLLRPLVILIIWYCPYLSTLAQFL